MQFVTLAEAKRHLYVDHEEDDQLITAYILAASAAVKNYLKSASPFQPELDPDYNPVLDSNGDTVYETDSNGDRVLMLPVEQATLILTGYFYRSRDNDEAGEWERGYLPRPVTALLYPLRDPAWA